MLPVINHAKNYSKYNDDKSLSGFILLQPTSPLRKRIDIDKACELFIKKRPDSLVSILKLKHIYNPESLYFLKNNNLINIFLIKLFLTSNTSIIILSFLICFGTSLIGI